MTTPTPPRPRPRPGPLDSPRRVAALCATAAGLAVLLTLADPGITIDEPLDVRPGRTYVQTLWNQGAGFFEARTVEAVFRDNAEHPPLGRWLLGVASIVGQPFETFFLGGPDPRGVYVVAGRLAPACCFAALVALVSHAAASRRGKVAGLAAGFGLAVMPRAFAHAHLAALDTFISFFWVAALLAADRALGARRPSRNMIAAGGAWGLALLTKIHAWLLIPIVAAWAVARLGPRRAAAPMLAWGAAGLLVLYAGWPWLWYDGPGRLARFLGTGVERATIHVAYFGGVYADRDVPWHYPWFYFAATVPPGLHLAGVAGLVDAWRRRREPGPVPLYVGSILFLLGLFSTRVPVYDGERLFLMAFPLWAIVIGQGFAAAWEALPARPIGRGLLALLLLGQGAGVVAYHPFQLSYYSLAVGGLPGAERLGLELTFWGDAVDAGLLGRLAADANPGESAALVPTLYPGQGIMTTDRRLAARSIVLGDQESAPTADWVVVSRRTAYWPPGFADSIRDREPVAVRSVRGVWLSALYRRNPAGIPRNPGAPR